MSDIDKEITEQVREAYMPLIKLTETLFKDGTISFSIETPFGNWKYEKPKN